MKLNQTPYLLFLSASLIACSTQDKKDANTKAIANVKAVQKVEVSGTSYFSQTDDQVNISIKLTGLEPNKKFGAHIHEKGDCSGKNAENSGGHFSPKHDQHGSLNKDSGHAGDLGNLESNSQGIINVKIDTDKLSLKNESERYIVGRAIVVHEGADDLSTQPSGDSGSPIACGVITKS